MRRRQSQVLRRSMFDEWSRCRLLGYMLVIDQRGCRIGALFYFILGVCCAVDVGAMLVL